MKLLCYKKKQLFKIGGTKKRIPILHSGEKDIKMRSAVNWQLGKQHTFSFSFVSFAHHYQQSPKSAQCVNILKITYKLCPMLSGDSMRSLKKQKKIIGKLRQHSTFSFPN